MPNIGVLALQGSVAEHIKMLSRIDGVKPIEVRTIGELERVSGLILPGGESTTIGKLMKDYQLIGPIVKKANEGMPIWGTCAGMILMAKEIVGEEQLHLGIMDISVRRNAYGGQMNSFDLSILIDEVLPDIIPLVFIRAPWVEEVYGGARTLAKLEDRIIAVRQANLLATSFHPELTDNYAFHEYFTEMVKAYKI